MRPCLACQLPIHSFRANERSIKHVVLGCLEGVFAQGQIYVLISFILSVDIMRNANTGSVTESATDPTTYGFKTPVPNASRKF